jgi:hypothetical protein
VNDSLLPRFGAGVAGTVLVAGVALLVAALRNPYAGEPLPAPRCRRPADCGGRTTCTAGGRCGFGGTLRLGIRVPEAGGDWRWLHVRVRDVAEEFPERLATWPIEHRRVFPEVDGLPEGRFAVELHGSPRPESDAPCRGDLRQTVDLEIRGGIARIGPGGRGGTFVHLAQKVSGPTCASGAPGPMHAPLSPDPPPAARALPPPNTLDPADASEPCGTVHAGGSRMFHPAIGRGRP